MKSTNNINKTEKYNIEVNYQPLNRTWGVFLRNGQTIHNEIDESLTIAFAETAKFILSLSEMNINFGNGDIEVINLR